MSRFFPFACFCLSAFLFSGCLTTPVSGPGAITVTNSNVTAIMAAATSVFAQSGYTSGPANYPDSISFDKPAGAFGEAMWGSYGNKQTIRAKVKMIPIAGTNDYNIAAQVFTVSSAGEAGFEDSRKLPLWSAEFKPLLRKIQVIASGAGPQ